MVIAALSEEQRQLTTLALAELSVKRPGFEAALQEAAEAIQAAELYASFRAIAQAGPLPSPSRQEGVGGT